MAKKLPPPRLVELPPPGSPTPDDVLDAAKGLFKTVVLVGIDQDNAFHLLSSQMTEPQELFLLATGQKRVLEGV